ncbi:pilus assembly protein TadE [Kutzneria buriramensis]|uniref:TadE-like protein n=1 Tax=Kutzneria buriramensis TaxID=1045776 RepID=A0A3E0GUM5_9PSEU|nr:pilus assembly protein TadE [Kutzneria buriramensis]REH28642.1 hypothetical protein BCF44_12684 [Kutzneria buriramensis]
MTGRLRQAVTGEDGAVTTEVALYVPITVVVACLLWAFGATYTADSAVLHATINAARQASLARTAAQAQRDATAVARQILDEHNLRCRTMTVTVDTAGFGVPVGQPAQVAVDVDCQISLADLAVPGLSGQKTLHEHQVSPLDTSRARQ